MTPLDLALLKGLYQVEFFVHKYVDTNSNSNSIFHSASYLHLTCAL